jgi:tRNA nucleotidyltransferase (CCA-adding enzyme)
LPKFASAAGRAAGGRGGGAGAPPPPPPPPSELRALLGSEPPEALALALALGAPAEPVLRWTTSLSTVGLEIGGDDLLEAGVPEGPAIGRALEETLRRKLDGLVDGRDEELETALALARSEAD